MEPLPVVKDFGPLEDGRARLLARCKMRAMHRLAFEPAPEAFHHGVVITVAAPAHARNNARPCEHLPASIAGVLDAPVGMMHPILRAAVRGILAARRNPSPGGDQTLATANYNRGYEIKMAPELFQRLKFERLNVYLPDRRRRRETARNAPPPNKAIVPGSGTGWIKSFTFIELTLMLFAADVLL